MEEIKVDLPKFFEKKSWGHPSGRILGISWVEHGKLSMFWAELRDHGRLKTFSWQAPTAFFGFFLVQMVYYHTNIYHIPPFPAAHPLQDLSTNQARAPQLQMLTFLVRSWQNSCSDRGRAWKKPCPVLSSAAVGLEVEWPKVKELLNPLANVHFSEIDTLIIQSLLSGMVKIILICWWISNCHQRSSKIYQISTDVHQTFIYVNYFFPAVSSICSSNVHPISRHFHHRCLSHHFLL